MTCKLKDAYQDCVLSLDGQTPDAEGQITIENVDCGEAYKLALTNPEGKEVATAEVQFTFLPLVEVNVPSCNGSYYTSGHIRVTDANFPGHDSLFIAAIVTGVPRPCRRTKSRMPSSCAMQPAILSTVNTSVCVPTTTGY